MLYIIGIGLGGEKDITVKGLESLKKCSKIYLESYTSLLQCSVEDLEKFYGKKIIVADRSRVEDGEEILEAAKNEDIALLIIGDVFCATTHYELYKQAKEYGIKVEVIHNSTVLTAVSITGLQLYKFGRIASIPLDNENLTTPYDIWKQNGDTHTLFLLDIKADENRFMTVNEGLEYLMRFPDFKEDTLCLGCARLAFDDFLVKTGTAKELLEFDFGKPPHCLIVPGKMHFLEEEAFEQWA